MKTIRASTLGQAVLRLVEKVKTFIGVVISAGAKEAEIRGDDAPKTSPSGSACRVSFG